MSEVGFIGKVFGRKTETEARKKTTRFGPRDAPMFASRFKQGKGSCAYLVTRDPDAKYSARDIAIAVQINQPVARFIMEYLKSKEINANLIVITNNEDVKSTKDLDDCNEKEWHAIVQDFKDIVTKIQTELGTTEFHFFFAAPAALTMALGVIFGNFLNARVYNWVKGESTYTEVLRLPIRR